MGNFHGNFPCFFLDTQVAQPGPPGPDTHGAVDPATHDVAEQSTTGSDQYTWLRSKTPGGPGETEMKQVFMWYITGKC